MRWRRSPKPISDQAKQSLDEKAKRGAFGLGGDKLSRVLELPADGPVWEAGLRLLTCETRVTPCRYREGWLARQQGGAAGAGGEEEARKHASAFIGTLRSWSNSTALRLYV